MNTTPHSPAEEEPTAADEGAEPARTRDQRVAGAVKGWQSHLVGLGGPNALLWFQDLPGGTLDLTTAHPGGVAMLLAGHPTRLSDLVREPRALQDARRRARLIRAKAVELHEERGITAGFIAVGMATWRIAGPTRRPAAPVLLRRCVLRPTGAAQLDFDVDLGADVELNPVLAQYLRSEQGIVLDAQALADRATATKGFDPHPVYVEISRACGSVPEFRISPRLVIGTFSRDKLPMVADLAAQRGSLAGHHVVAALAGDPAARATVRTTLPQPPADTEDTETAEERLVLDADCSQQAVVAAVRAGASLVVQGPPGTGKSQTIANVVADLAGQGRSVLFVAEKRAALESVVHRLDQIGLGELVLDAQDGSSDRTRLIGELVAALDPPRAVHDPDTTEVEAVLAERRTRLMDHAASMHDRRSPWDVSAFDAQVALTRLCAAPHPPVSRVRLRGDRLRAITGERRDELSSGLAEAASLGAWTVGEGEDPWYGSRFTSPEEASRALEITTRLSGGGLASGREQADRLAEESGLPVPVDLAGWQHLLTLMEAVRDSLEVFRPEVFDAPLGELVVATASRTSRRDAASQSGLLERSWLRRQVRHLLRPGTPPADLHGVLEQAQAQLRQWQKLAGSGSRPVAPAGLEEAAQSLALICQDVSWLGQRLAGTRAGNDLADAELDELQARLVDLTSRADRLLVVPRVVAVLDVVRAAGLGGLADDLARRGVAAADVPAEVEFVWWTSLLADITEHDPRYGQHDGDRLRADAAAYIQADRALLAAAAARVRAAVAARTRELCAQQPEQVALVRAAAVAARGGDVLLGLWPRVAELLTAVRPCWAMSPLVVASLLPPGRWFDVVIFDEASQIATAEAVSAISRAAQVVVVGDEHQLLPTSFSTAAGDDVIVDQDGVMVGTGSTSVLDALSAVLPVLHLTWHYRSSDEHLIAFANERVYGGALVTFPGAVGGPALELEVVAADRAEVETARVVERVLHHARTRPRESLGVVTLGVTQAARIGQALREALAGVRDVTAFFGPEAPERFFVKDVDRVQGDVRDAIILAIGDGGGGGGDAGDRRLNVAITRARRRMVVLSLIGPDDLETLRPDDLETVGTDDPGSGRSRPAGTAMLRDFLRHAAAGARSADAVAPGGSSESPTPSLVAELARRLRADGLVVHQDVGLSVHRLDLTIEDPRHPGRPLVAVETDGPAYAAMAGTRERDRLRIEQLERLGWAHVRVWTTDVFRDPARDVARVTAAVWAASGSEPAAGDARTVTDGTAGR